MRTQILFTLVIALLFSCNPAFGQEAAADSTSEEGSGMTVKHGKYRRSLELNYGSSSPRYEGLNPSFASLGLFEMKIGFTSLDELKYNLISMDQQYGFFSLQNSDLSASGGPESGEIGSEMTRFGFGNRRGHGYGGSGKGFIFYNQDGLDWTQITPSISMPWTRTPRQSSTVTEAPTGSDSSPRPGSTTNCPPPSP